MKTCLLLLTALLIAPIANAQDHSPVVAAIKARLEAAGTDLSGPCGAFQVTKRVAWELRSQGFGLHFKGGGNNCEGFAVDYIIQAPTFFGFDILGDGGGANVPQWIGPEDHPDIVARNRGSWRAPTDPGDTPPPPVDPPDNGDHDAIVDLMGDLQKQMADFRQWAEAEIAAVRAEHKAQDPKLDKGTPIWQILIGILGAIAGGVGATK